MPLGAAAPLWAIGRFAAHLHYRRIGFRVEMAALLILARITIRPLQEWAARRAMYRAVRRQANPPSIHQISTDHQMSA